MSDQNIKIGLQVSSNGTTEAETKKALGLKAAYDAAASSAAKIGGTGGSRAMAAKAAPVGSQALIDDKQYNQLRGAAGVTGASARDFANQAQGLGGLVRLYATFAANIFAATAAFSALKNAADTTNLVRGLDTLGASAGKSLGTLSKRLVEVTDGAISMREAMTAVAQTSSAGMSSQNIERLSLVAKNASLALGVSMPDALNRLSRGITKLEPELLDELGLFTKIGPATEEYARQIGKTAGSLTDFERRQAFANAVLEEGEKKFGALAQAASNPYDKLLASLKDVLQSGLALVNKVLTPIVSLLAESPAALSTVLAGIGFVLLKQALPAIGQFRAGLRASAQDALAAAETFKSSFGDQFQDIIEKRFKIPDIESQIKKTEQALAKSSFGGTKPKSLQALEGGELNQKNINKLLETRQKIIDEGIIRGKQASAQQIATAKQEADYIKLQVKLYEQRNQLAAARAGTEEVANKPVGRFDPEVINLRKYDQLRTAVNKSEAIANAAQVAQVAGVRNAWALLNKEVGEKGLTGFAKYSTLAQGGLAAIGSRVMGVVGSLGALGQAIGIAVAVFQGLDMVFSKNAKQMEKFNSSIETADESVANVKRTLDAAKSAEGFSTRTIENTMAFSTALNELTDNMKSAIKASREAEEAAGWWDKFTDAVARAFGTSRDDKLGKAVAKQISSSIDLLSREGLDEEYAEQIKKILNVNSLADIDAVGAAWKRLSKDQKDALTAIQEQANRSLGNAAAAIQSFRDKSSEATKTYKDFLNSFLDTSPAFKLGVSLIEVGNSLQMVIDAGPDRVAQAFDDIAKNSDKAALLGKNFVNGFTQIAKAFTQETLVVNALNDAVKQYQKNLEALRAEREKIQKYGMNQGSAVQQENLARNREQMGIVTSDLITARKAAESIATPAINAARKLLEEGTKAIVEQGRALIQRSIKEAEFTGGQAITRALAGMLTGERKAQVEGQLAVDELKFRISTLKANEQLISTQSDLNNQMQLNNALQAEANALYRLNNAEQKKDTNAIDRLTKELQAAQRGVGESKARAGLALTDEESNLLGESVINRIRTQQESARLTAQQAVQAPRIQLERQLTAQQISNRQGEFRGREEDIKAEEQIQNRINAALLARQQVYFSLTDSADQQLIAARQTLELTDKQNRDKQETAELERRVAQIRVEANDADINGRTDLAFKYSEELNLLTDRLNKIKEAQAIENDTTGIKNRQELSKAQAEGYERQKQLFEAQAEADKIRLDSELQLKQVKLDTELAVESALLKNLQLTEGARSVIEYQASLRQAALDRDRTKIQANADFERQEAINLFEIRKTLAKNQTADGDITAQGQAEIAQIYAREAAQKAGRDAAVKSADAQYNKTVQIAGATKQAALEQQAYNDQLQLAADISASLQGAFEGATGALGQFGQNLGSVIDTLARVGELNDKNAKTSAALDEKRTAAIETFGLKSKEVAEIDEQISAQNKKSVRDEVTGYAQIAGSAKKMFKEKTVAYKLLDATEKAMHLWRMASAIREMVMEKAGTAVSLAESAKKIGAKVVEAGTDGVAAVVKAISAFPPPFNFIAGAATAAAVGMLLSQIGAKSPKAPAGFGAEAAQKVQGTGQAYDASGNIVTRSGGVTGDPTERADSIVSSIEILNTNVFNMLGSKSSTIAKLLSGIKDNTAVFALSLRGRLPGYANMLAPDQVSDTTGTMSTLGLGLGGAAGFKLGGFFGGPFGALVGGALGALAGALFGTKTTRSVEDSGINISGTAGGLGRGVGTFENYANIKTTKKSFFGGTRVSYAMQAEQMAQDSINAASRIITDINDALVLAGDALEGSGTRVVSLLDQIPIQIKVSAKGLSAKEYAEAVTSEISVQLNSAAEQVFPYLVQYNKIGEEMYETVSRIVSEGESLSYGLKMIGGAITETDAAAKVAKQQDLINYLGGIKEAGDSINYYFENFISAEEQYRFNLGRLTTAFSDASLTLPKTKKEFSALVDSVKNVDSDEARQTLATLLTYSEDFDKLLSASNDLRGEELKNLEDSASKLRDYAKSLREFNNSLATGSLSIATPLEKFAQLQAEFTSASGLAKTGDLAALGKLQGLSQDLLTSGRELWASGPKYAELFGTVTATLADVANFADAKADVQELQLTALKDTVSLLSNIDANMAALAGGNALQTAATGGYRSGLTLVGELGPELVDFQTPGRVYTADQTAGMFAQAPNGQQFNLVVAELQQLRQEVATLRKDQQRQTGDLIVTNYDATNKLAEQITDAVVQTVTDSSWQNRSKPQIK